MTPLEKAMSFDDDVVTFIRNFIRSRPALQKHADYLGGLDEAVQVACLHIYKSPPRNTAGVERWQTFIGNAVMWGLGAEVKRRHRQLATEEDVKWCVGFNEGRLLDVPELDETYQVHIPEGLPRKLIDYIKTMRVKDRQLLEARFVHGLQGAATARQLGCTKQHVYGRTTELVKRMRGVLGVAKDDGQTD